MKTPQIHLDGINVIRRPLPRLCEFPPSRLRRSISCSLVVLGLVCLWFGLSERALSAAPVYVLAVEGGPSNNQLDANRRATYSFKVKIDPASGRTETNSVGTVCLSRTGWWEWVDPTTGTVTNPPRVPQLQNMNPVSVQGTIRSKGADSWSGSRDVTFFVVMDVDCPTGGTGNESNPVTKSLALASPTLSSSSLTLKESPPLREAKPDNVVRSLGADQVAVVNFWMTPPDPIEGDKARLYLRVKNTGTAAISNIPWEMTTGEQAEAWNHDTWPDSVAPGQEFTVWRDWVATPGRHRFDGWADPKNEFKESANNRRNNIAKTIDVTVPKIVSQLIDRKEAEKNGAKFLNNNEQGDCGIDDPGEDSHFSSYLDSIVFYCRPMTLLVATGSKGKPEAFKDFKLKNRWRIKQVDIQVISNWGGYSWLARPSVGGDNPYMQLLIWADPPNMTPHELNPPNSKAGETTIVVKIWITGPEGWSPYRIMFPGEKQQIKN